MPSAIRNTTKTILNKLIIVKISHTHRKDCEEQWIELGS